MAKKKGDKKTRRYALGAAGLGIASPYFYAKSIDPVARNKAFSSYEDSIRYANKAQNYEDMSNRSRQLSSSLRKKSNLYFDPEAQYRTPKGQILKKGSARAAYLAKRFEGHRLKNLQKGIHARENARYIIKGLAAKRALGQASAIGAAGLGLITYGSYKIHRKKRK